MPGNVVANLWKPGGFLQPCASYPNKFIPTNSTKLMGPDPMKPSALFNKTLMTFACIKVYALSGSRFVARCGLPSEIRQRHDAIAAQIGCADEKAALFHMAQQPSRPAR